MNAVQVEEPALVDCAIAGRALEGQSVSGDQHVIKPFKDGVLLAVIDGVGHGQEAAAAAKSAADILATHASGRVSSLVKLCHESLAHTRGVVMTVASLNALGNTMSWLGVGNVEGRILRADHNNNHPCESVLLRNGLVGLHLPALYAGVVALAPGDLLILATDGIRAGFERGVNRTDTPRQIAQQILDRHFKGTDDALVLAARYDGIPHPRGEDINPTAK